MNSLASKLLVAVCLLAGLIAWDSAHAQDKRQRKNDPSTRIKKKLQEAGLPADVQEKVNKILAEQGPKLTEAQAKVDAVLTAEQKQAQTTAQKAAKEAGKKKKEAVAEVEAAAKMTAEQKTKLAAATKELNSAQTALTSALKGALTAEQQEKLLGKRKKA